MSNATQPPFQYRQQAEDDLDPVRELRDQVYALFVQTAAQVAEDDGGSTILVDALDDLLAAQRRLSSAVDHLIKSRAYDLWGTAQIEAAKAG